MTTHTNVPPLVHITGPDFAAGYEEAQLPCYADCAFRTDLNLVETVRGMLTEYAVEMVSLSSNYDVAQALLLGY